MADYCVSDCSANLFCLTYRLISDFIPVVGYLDDAAVISFVVASIKADLDNFLEWEDEQKRKDK